MRIIAGIAKGLPLAVPGGDVRPTSDRVREAIFSSLGERVVSADVLDLYAGSGALGLEAASRGARRVVFVEKACGSLAAMERNIAKFRKGRQVECELNIRRGDVLPVLSRQGDVFSLIFADPPYGEPVGPLLAAMERSRLLADAGVFVFESAKRDMVVVALPWIVRREAVYGDTRVSYLERPRTPARA